MGQSRWHFIPLSKWVITPVINGISRVNPLITGVITHLLSGMNIAIWPRHQMTTLGKIVRKIIQLSSYPIISELSSYKVIQFRVNPLLCTSQLSSCCPFSHLLSSQLPLCWGGTPYDFLGPIFMSDDFLALTFANRSDNHFSGLTKPSFSSSHSD